MEKLRGDRRACTSPVLGILAVCSVQQVLTLINVTGSHGFSDAYIDAEVLDRIIYLSHCTEPGDVFVCSGEGTDISSRSSEVKAQQRSMT